MKKTRDAPKSINYEVISEFIEIFSGLVALSVSVGLAKMTCTFLSIKSIWAILLFYFLWLAVFIVPATLINPKLEDFFQRLNDKWSDEWHANKKMGRSE
jgi:hypothetical protein